MIDDRGSDNPLLPDGAEHDPLDDLLRQARWPEPSAPDGDRLRAAWTRIWQEQSPGTVPVRSRRFVIAWSNAAAIAAMIALASALVWLAHRAPDAPRLLTDNGGIGSTPTPVIHPAAPLAYPPLAGREPTLRERLLLASLNVDVGPRLADDALLARQSIARALDELVDDPTTDTGKLAAQLRSTYRPSVLQQALDATLDRAVPLGDAERASAVARLVAEFGDPRHVPLLRALMNQPASRDVAIAALCRIADAPTLASLAGEQSASAARRSFLAALLNRPDARIADLFLPFVEDPDLRRDALAAAANATDPPIRALFDVLSHDGRMDRRLAAARALGAIDSPQVTEQLAEMLAADRNTREALAVLLCSPQRTGTAAAKLASARRSPALWAIVNSVESQLVAEP